MKKGISLNKDKGKTRKPDAMRKATIGGTKY